jgi:hypothetical protein
MLIGYLTLLSGLMISAVAIYYSVEGLVAIYPAMVVPIVIMGVVIELGKLSLTVWLKQFWDRAPVFLKAYMLPAIAVLMLITSIGVFGFLSKAHSDQTLVSGDVQSKIAIYDEKIKVAKENIDANRKALKQMDEAVDQVMGRSQDEKGADKAVALRKGQAKERTRLLSEITAEQKVIAQLSEERAPIAAEVRKVEADVGPIKYIAAFIYGANPDANVLEKAVTWITVLIVIVLDPLAVVLLLASQYSFAWAKEQKGSTWLDDQADELTQAFFVPDVGEKPAKEELEVHPDEGVADEILKAGFTNSNPKDNLPIETVEKEAFEGVRDPSTGEWIQTGPSFKYQEPVEYHFGEEIHEEEYVPVTVTKDKTTPEEDEAFETLARQQEANSYYIGLDRKEEPKPEKEHEVSYHADGEYININGQMYHHSAIPPEFQQYKVSHTKDSVILTDENGQTTEHKFEEPTYVQNEEQKESNLWQNIVQSITPEEYQQKARKNGNG